MHFKSGAQEPKATLEIGSNTYKIMPPTLGQADSFSAQYNQKKNDPEAVSLLMKQYVCELGSIPMDELNKVENDLFVELFSHVTTSKKK